MDRYFDYFQIAGLAFFLTAFLGRTLYLRFSKNVNPITLGVGKKGLRRIVELSFFVGLIAWIVELLLYALNTKFRLFPAPLNMQLIDSTPVKLIGVVLVIISFIIFIWALVSFRDSWRIGIDEKTQGDLVTNGIFALSRNPIFIFIDIYFIGTFLINGTLIFLIFAALTIIGLHYQIIQEEKFLARTYGQAYQNYCARTRRYFGWQRALNSNR
ncbi:MAG: isoprenylcysteine carboxylmethyltransferase family protein [Calditrichaeota bacterium]|nr:isoprenylcysteine carboxylmethyltransferase family protein [Calditrichota bacterium]